VPLSDQAAVPAIVGLAVGIALIVTFSTIFQTPESHIPKVSTVTIPKNGSDPDGQGFVPKIIKVVIGTNNTIRWINHDLVPSSVYADSQDDPLFYDATKDQCENNDYHNCVVTIGKNTLIPGGTFEFTFTKPGSFGYHSVPHPQMKGTVIVVSSSE